MVRSTFGATLVLFSYETHWKSIFTKTKRAKKIWFLKFTSVCSRKESAHILIRKSRSKICAKPNGKNILLTYTNHNAIRILNFIIFYVLPILYKMSTIDFWELALCDKLYKKSQKENFQANTSGVYARRSQNLILGYTSSVLYVMRVHILSKNSTLPLMDLFS
jgi:hypothetical protein